MWCGKPRSQTPKVEYHEYEPCHEDESWLPVSMQQVWCDSTVIIVIIIIIKSYDNILWSYYSYITDIHRTCYSYMFTLYINIYMYTYTVSCWYLHMCLLSAKIVMHCSLWLLSRGVYHHCCPATCITSQYQVSLRFINHSLTISKHSWTTISHALTTNNYH